MNRGKIGIIGAGPAGMMGAIQAARIGGTVTLFEKNDRVGKKILMTGNGKCNLSNRFFCVENYHSEDIELLDTFLSQFGVEQTISFFQELGLLLKNKAGYLYPFSEQSSTVLDILRLEIKRLKIQVITEEEIVYVHKKELFILQGQKNVYYFDKILIATGGRACPKSGSDGAGLRFAKQLGHTLVDQVPALVQLKCAKDYWKSISGVRCDVSLCLYVDHVVKAVERGELQLTDYGISGIPVFQLSRHAAYGLQKKQLVTVSIDFFPDEDLAKLVKEAKDRYSLYQESKAEEFFIGYLNKKLMFLMMKLSEIKGNSFLKDIPFWKIQKVFEQMKEFCIEVTDTNSFQNAQVSAGGVALHEITKKMESNIVKGLYFAGEVLDVDGRCGGYNLQWAWTSGYLAGQNMAKEQKVT